ncbi:MAG: glycosyltransferase [Clostridia bacterium]|nr:glycosyltransferase [Clostridia bacterium]
MKILVATDTYKPIINGVSVVAELHAKELKRRGEDVKVLTLTEREESYREDYVYFLPSYPSHIYPDWKKTHIRKHPFIDEIIRWKPDVIHIHSEGSICAIAKRIAAACGDTPYVMTTHTDFATYAFGKYHDTFPVSLLMSTLGYFAYRRAKVVTLPSEKAGDFQQNKHNKKKAVVVPNGIDLQRYRKPVTPEERKELLDTYGIRDNGKILLALSRISKEKRIQDLLSYLPSLLEADPEIQLVVVGDGPYKQDLEELAEKLGIASSVVFTGRIPPDEVYRFYDIGTIFVSTSNFEVHSLTFLEAISRGLPLICLKDPSLKGVLMDGEDGFTFEGKDDFCDCVLRLLNDKELYQSMRENALKVSENFSEEAFVDRMMEIYEKILKEDQNGETDA